jgi:hypothetical protein
LPRIATQRRTQAVLTIDFVDVFAPEHSLRDGFTTYSVISPVRPGFVVTVASRMIRKAWHLHRGG